MSRGFYGSSYDRQVDRTDTSTFHKMKETYWTTKQVVIQKLGKKEDEHVVASDCQLDSKLEVFRSVQTSCMDLLHVIERYQDRLCVLSQEENSMGRFMKSRSGHDKTRAGKMMAAVGKSQSFAAQQRLALRVPLVRLYQEVETFRYRAISDTLMTINRMEGARTEYRGALLWMKAVSEELDPDTYKQLEKFRKVQTQVRKTKAKFDKLKLDVMQKVDLLAASRCNMFSHVLANYQSTLLHFWEKTSRTMTAVSESFKGYQYYEFSMLKELAEPSKKLIESTSHLEQAERDTDDFDPERLISFGENSEEQPEEKNGSMQNLFTSSKSDREAAGSPFMDFEDDDKKIEDMAPLELSKRKGENDDKKQKKNGGKDLLMDALEPDDTDKDDMTLLNEILNAPSTGEDEFTREWQAVFGNTPLSPDKSYTPVESDQDNSAEFMPSNLLELTSQISRLRMGADQPNPMKTAACPMSTAGPMNTMPTQPSLVPQPSASALPISGQGSPQPKPRPAQSKKGQDMSAWFNLFADLDPLSNPDAIGKSMDDITDA